MEDVFGVGKVVEKLADPVVDLIKKVAGPAAEEVGLTMRDSVHVYRAKRAYHLAEKFRRFTAERGIDPKAVSLKLLLPILDGASIEEDEDLHTMWANLLANAADPREKIPVLPAFLPVLRELTPRDAQFLNVWYQDARQNGNSYSEDELTKLGAKVGLVPEELIILPAQSRQPQAKPDLVILHTILDTLKRNGLIGQTVYPHDLGASPVYNRLPLPVIYYISNFGVEFIRACLPPEAS
jgi:hypothetical protein